MTRSVTWEYLGESSVVDAHQRMALRAQTVQEDERTIGWLQLQQHPPTFTLGRRPNENNLHVDTSTLTDLGFEVVQTDRGGLVTYHGPGQLVVYPIVHLGRLACPRIPDFVSKLETVMIELCALAGISASRMDGFPGVWVGEEKIGAIGLHVSNQVVTHGFALNLAPDLGHYQYITPCGILGKGVTSFQKLGKTIPMRQAVEHAVRLFGEVFHIEMVAAEKSNDSI